MVKENQDDLQSLQKILDDSIENAGEFIKKEFKMPQNSFSASEIVKLFQGRKTVSMATVTVKGEPRVAPVGGHLYRGYFHIPSVNKAARTRHLLKRPGISMTYYEGVDVAIIVHGKAILIDNKDETFNELVQWTGENVDNWGDKNEGVFIKIIPDSILTFNRYP